ncbi:uncharacterized protein MELLADRAFT_107050 [Melampsora larici-populina 98AG31]|uniref:Uncharacterized protein n=1 Tax=Melampsora larici-populina (strain 98AG31 / pathotype 3-4-7) TaxID=747676 RepID=F4RNH9_MELLP|nr:uncharacterized protein MELLADRAFT_107050 [Melampsora larici-populina 98AG31]EGG06095.1 hypothetical protein MELLADRAFT_107050 [Melampsora larici-populina 98AG31]
MFQIWKDTTIEDSGAKGVKDSDKGSNVVVTNSKAASPNKFEMFMPKDETSLASVSIGISGLTKFTSICALSQGGCLGGTTSSPRQAQTLVTYWYFKQKIPTP